MNASLRYLPRQAGCVARRLTSSTSRAYQPVSPRLYDLVLPPSTTPSAQSRWLSASASNRKDHGDDDRGEKGSPSRGLGEEEQQARVKQNQVKRPWLRQDADKSPADAVNETQPSKGKLLTTPTRLLKLIIPLPIRVEKDQENNSYDYGRALSRNDAIQPLALLVHPQQPLSYVERLIQAELPPVIEDGKEKIPNIYFRAEDPGHSDDNNNSNSSSNAASSSDENPHVANYSGLGHEAAEPEAGSAPKKWVRWSSSTEMGDFIRDAARGREFAIEVEGYNLEMRIGVPSFRDRTYYLRIRLRRMSREIDSLAQIKKECDQLAHRGAHRIAQSGLALLAGWWGVVYYITFMTDFGWDLVEPWTYLVGLATIMGGYMWFLFISRDLSYKSAMNITVSRRQSALYESKGFEVERWDHLVHDANALRKEIRTIAGEYDVDWDETKDLGGERVKKVLEKERVKAKKGNEDDDDDQDEDDEDEAEAREEEAKVKKEMTKTGKTD